MSAATEAVYQMFLSQMEVHFHIQRTLKGFNSMDVVFTLLTLDVDRLPLLPNGFGKSLTNRKPRAAAFG